HFYSGAGCRIACYVRASLPRAKAAESPNLDVIAALQRPYHAVENPFYDSGSLLSRNVLQYSAHCCNQIRFGEDRTFGFRLSGFQRELAPLILMPKTGEGQGKS